jgi:hypothetical protein
MEEAKLKKVSIKMADCEPLAKSFLVAVKIVRFSIQFLFDVQRSLRLAACSVWPYHYQ